MCGISGIYGHKNVSLAETTVMQMNNCMAHRGPDAQGLWSNEEVVLGHRRLSIIDTSEAGNQPFISRDNKIVIVFNGEIYNYIELKKELSHHYNFHTATDTEVIIAAYLHWGIDCLKHFIGMFGFALYDVEKEKLFIVRDRLGIKPIYYASTKQGLLFASEIRSILSTDLVNRKISRNALIDYLHYQTVHAPNTIIEGVQMLMPGHYIELSKNESKTICYWNATDFADKPNLGESKTHVKKRVQELLYSSVEMRMRADVPFGAFLSGGIDSSIIVGLMSQISSHPVNTFSVTFHEKEFDESPYSSLIAKKFGTKHTPIQLRADDFLKLMPDALRAMDHPSGDGPNTYVVSKVTREAGVKMALSGLGGDELFAGYDVFLRMKQLENDKWMKMTPRLLRKVAGQILLKAKPSVSSEKIAEALAKTDVNFASFYPLTRQILPTRTIEKLLKEHSSTTNPIAATVNNISKSTLPLLSKVSVAEMETYMQNVLLRDSDQMSMAHALEIRVPFMDHRLVEYVLGVNDQLKYPHTPKQLLTDSFEDLLPNEVVNRPKMGFTFPWAIWMRGELKSFCEENLHALNQVEELDSNEVNALWIRFINNDPTITWSRIWPLVVLGHWVKQHDVH
jgi:asparagine synthase (glutamine-hydrolysing)